MAIENAIHVEEHLTDEQADALQRAGLIIGAAFERRVFVAVANPDNQDSSRTYGVSFIFERRTQERP